MDKYDIIIQGGQSNAEGFGIGAVTEEYVPDDDVLYLEAEKEISIEEGKGVVVKFPDKPFTIARACERDGKDGALGDFSLTFARDYKKNGLLKNGRKLLIVRAAVGGTGFMKKHWGTQDCLFLKMLEMTDYALSLNEENKVVAFLWHQGEHDAVELNTAREYYRQLSSMLSTVRSKYGDVPFVAGDFVSDWKNQHTDITLPIVDSIKNVVKDSGNAAFVETADLPSNDKKTGNGDPLHFSREALHILGERYFAAFSSLKKA